MWTVWRSGEARPAPMYSQVGPRARGARIASALGLKKAGSIPAAVLLLLALPAAAQGQHPPSALADAQHYVAYEALWPGPRGIETVMLYVVRQRQCYVEPIKTDLEKADLNGDGCVDAADLIEYSKLYDLMRERWGQCKESK